MQKGKRVSETVTDEVAASCAMCSLKQMDYTALPAGSMQIKRGRCLFDLMCTWKVQLLGELTAERGGGQLERAQTLPQSLHTALSLRMFPR